MTGSVRHLAERPEGALRAHVRESLAEYFQALNGHEPARMLPSIPLTHPRGTA